MAHRRDVDDDEVEMDPEEDEEVDEYGGYDDEEEDEEEEEEEEDEDDEEYVGEKTGKKRGRSNNVASRRGGKKSKSGDVQDLFDLEAAVSDDEEEEEDEGEEDFIVRDGADLPDEEDVRRMPRHSLFPHNDDQIDDIDAIERHIEEKYGRRETDYDDEGTEVDQQALLPSVRDPKLWMVKCAIGHEREVAVCLMQKAIDKWPEIQIKSAIALDHLKNYIYVEADKEAHVKEACKGMRNIYAAKLMLVPIKEMTDVLSVESKATDLCRDTWVRMKTGTYKGDLAKIVDVDNVRQRATVKLIPRIDLQALASKLEGREVQKKKAFTPPPRFMNIEEARDLHIRVDRRRDPNTGDYFENIGGMMFKDGFLYKTVSIKSISTQNIQPTFDELEKFRRPTENGDGDMAGLSTLFSNRKKGHFVKGDRVIVVKGDLKNLKGSVEKVEEETVYIKSPESGILDTLAVNGKELCKYFEAGNHVKVVSGANEGATGMVVSVEGHVVNIVSDTTKELLRVFADNVVESSEVTAGITRIGDYELHDLVQLDDMSFGVIIRVETEAFQVLKGVPEKPEVAHVKLREIKSKLDKKINSQDRNGNRLSVKDIVKILDGPCRGKQGPIEHIFKGILFVYDRHHLEHAGFICAKSQSCILVGGSRANRNRNVDPFPSRYPDLRSPSRAPLSPMRPPRDGRPLNPGGRYGGGGRGQNNLVNAKIKIRKGFYKGCKGVVKDIKGNTVRVELEAQMKVVTVNRDEIADVSNDLSTPFRGPSRFAPGSETPIHPSRTPLRPYMTPMRDVAATPIHEGMRTPMPDRAWNPYTPMTPAREEWEDGNPASWGTSPRYQSGSPGSRPYEAPTPAYSEAGTPRDAGNAPSPYLPSTPGGQPPMTPNSASLPGTPGGQPMTPGDSGLDMMSPAIGGYTEGGSSLLPEILVKVHMNGEDGELGVIKEVLPDGSCKITVGGLNGKVVTGQPNEIEVVTPRKNDRVKVIGGTHRGEVGKLVGIDGTDGIVKLDVTLDVKILFLDHLATLVQA